jgi:bile acid-coenzyme A ligase
LAVGVPHEDLGQVPYALIQAGAELDEQTVQEFLRDRVAGYKVPETVEFVDAPLRDDAGKARRSAVRAEIMARLILIALLCIVVCGNHGAIASS